MKRALELIAIAVVVAICGVLIAAATSPDVFEVRRTASIKAPPERIFPLINDLRAFNTWNPYERKDPDIEGSYSGAAQGKGAAYAFRGNRDVGEGRIEIVASSPATNVTMNLRMFKPFEASNTVEFALEPQGDVTNVTWAMRGTVPYIGKIVHLFFDMDRMVGRDFDTGLANLKSIVERREMAARARP